MLCVLCLGVAIYLLLALTGKWKWMMGSLFAILLVVNGVLLVGSNQMVKHTISLAPDYKHILSIKQNLDDNEAQYYHPNLDRKSTRLNSSHVAISYAVFCLKKKNIEYINHKQLYKTY